MDNFHGLDISQLPEDLREFFTDTEEDVIFDDDNGGGTPLPMAA